MPSEKDIQLVKQLIAAIKDERITWEPTAAVDEFTTSFTGQYSLIVANPPSIYTLSMLDSSEREMLRLVYDPDSPYSQGELNLVAQLFDLARRQALHVDRAVDNILQELES